MTSNLTAVVVGAPDAAAALADTSQFSQVVLAETTGSLRDLLASGQLSRAVDDKVFLFSDATVVDTPQNLPTLLMKLSATGAKVAVLATSPVGDQLVEHAPGVGLLSGDLHVNSVLAGIAGMFGDAAGTVGLSAVADRDNRRVSAAPTASAPPAPAPAAPAAGGAGLFAPRAEPTPHVPQAPDALTAPPAGYGAARPAPGGPFAPATQQWGAPAAAAVAEKPARLGRVITVTAPKGGVGKSSTTLNLATYLGLALKGTGRNVCVIDANVQQADSGKYLNVHNPNVEELLRHPHDIHPDRITAHLIHKPMWNLSVLLGPSEPLTASPIHYSGKLYARILEALRGNYDYIFIDTPVAELFHDMFRAFALPYADYILVLAEPNYSTLYDIDMWLRAVCAGQAAGGAGVDPSKIGILLNRAEDGIDCSEEDVRSHLAGWTYLGSVPETKEMKRANNNNELIATKPELVNIHQAFALVLQQVTGEPLVADQALLNEAKRGGLPAVLRRLFRIGGAR